MYTQPENQGLDNKLFESIINTNRDCNYHQLLDIKIKSVKPGIATLTMHIEDKHINPQNIVHGGATYSLADTAIGVATRSKNRVVSTLENSIKYLHSVKLGDTLTVTAKIVSFGNKIIVAQAEIVNQEDSPIAIITGTYYIRRKMLEGLE